MKEVSMNDGEEIAEPGPISDLEEGCGGTGFLNCFCGGDQCVCHPSGGIECDGCDDCDWEDEDWDEEDEA